MSTDARQPFGVITFDRDALLELVGEMVSVLSSPSPTSTSRMADLSMCEYSSGLATW